MGIFGKFFKGNQNKTFKQAEETLNAEEILNIVADKMPNARIEYYYEIKDKIRGELGFTVNVGIGENKLCAKMASDFEKPDKVHTLFPDEIPAKMWPLPVGELLFIGGATANKLTKLGIRTIGELAKFDVNALRNLLGDKMSVQCHNYANGIDNSRWRMTSPPTSRRTRFCLRWRTAFPGT